MNIRYLYRILIVGLIGIVVSASVMAAAQTHGRHQQGAQFFERVADKLNLTETQRTQIRGILESAKNEALNIKNSNLTPEQKRSEFMTLRSETKAQIRNVLTHEQRVQFDQMIKRWGGKVRKGMKCLAQLDLTPEQKEKAKAIHQTTREKIQAVKSNAALTDAQKKESIMAIRKEAKNEFIQILTPEQREKLKQCWGRS